jgi:hypothetical protein
MHVWRERERLLGKMITTENDNVHVLKEEYHTQQYLNPCNALLLHGLSLPRAMHTCSSESPFAFCLAGLLYPAPPSLPSPLPFPIFTFTEIDVSMRTELNKSLLYLPAGSSLLIFFAGLISSRSFSSLESELE